MNPLGYSLYKQKARSENTSKYALCMWISCTFIPKYLAWSIYFPKQTAIESQEQERRDEHVEASFSMHTRSRRPSLSCKGKLTRIKGVSEKSVLHADGPFRHWNEVCITSKLLAVSSAEVLCWGHNCFTAVCLRLGGSTQAFSSSAHTITPRAKYRVCFQGPSNKNKKYVNSSVCHTSTTHRFTTPRKRS